MWWFHHFSQSFRLTPVAIDILTQIVSTSHKDSVLPLLQQQEVWQCFHGLIFEEHQILWSEPPTVSCGSFGWMSSLPEYLRFAITIEWYVNEGYIRYVIIEVQWLILYMIQFWITDVPFFIIFPGICLDPNLDYSSNKSNVVNFLTNSLTYQRRIEFFRNWLLFCLVTFWCIVKLMFHLKCEIYRNNFRN